jgi:hypothetical protein
MIDIYLELVNPFHLPKPSFGWLQAIADYDAELVIFPSQKQYVYRLARRARKSGALTGQYFGRLPNLHPDTKVMFEHQLVPVTTIPAGAIHVPPFNIVEQLKARDQWRVGGGNDAAAADRVAGVLDLQDRAREQAVDDHNRAELRTRARAMRTGYQYRTGARVSLVRPPKPRGAAAAPDTTATGG